MKHAQKFHRVAALVAAVIILIGSITTANADLITYSDTYGLTVVGSAAGWAGASLSKFDPSLGTLTMVTLTLDSNTSDNTIVWDNEAGVATDVTLGIGTKVTINVFSMLAATTIPLQTGSSSVTADSDGSTDFSGSDAFSFIGGSGSDSNSSSSTNAAILALFTGVGTFDAWLSSSISTLISTTDGFGPSFTIAGLTYGKISVTYEYIPTPEPATIALLGLSSIALRRRLKL